MFGFFGSYSMMGKMLQSHDLIIIFGRTPRLSFQELAAVVPAFGVTAKPVWLEGESALLSRSAPWSEQEMAELQRTLGGTVRIAERAADCTAETFASTAAKLVLTSVPAEGKITVGLSSWADKGKPKPPASLARQVKHALTVAGRSVRTVVPPVPRTHLSAPHLIHNKLVGHLRAVDLVCFWIKGAWILGITRTVQDISDYTKRDFGIPKPNPVSGMLPPKLAQTMINLAVGAHRDAAIYDPFCGNGRVILEAALLGLPAFGSDIEADKVTAAATNLDWLCSEYGLSPEREGFWTQDAQDPDAIHAVAKYVRGTKWHIVTEPYLGKPLRHKLTAAEGEVWAKSLRPLYDAFATVWAQAPHNNRPESILMVMPRVKTERGTAGVRDSLVDRLEDLGYRAEVLFCYERPDSIVQRDLVRLNYR